jgi:O-antigen/teichoic acid export membrane protein
VRNTVVNALGSVSGVLVTLLLTPLLIHRLGTDAFGIWALATTLTFGVGYLSLADLGLEFATMRFMADARGQGDIRLMNTYLSSSVVLLGGMALVLPAILVPLAGPLTHLFDVPHALQGAAVVTFQFVLAQVAFELPSRPFYAALEAAQRFGLWQLIRLIQTILFAAAMVTVLVADPNLATLARATFAAAAATFLVSVALAFVGVREIRLSPRLVSRAALRDLVGTGSVLLAFQLIESIYRQIDKTVIGIMLTSTFVGVYEIGNKLAAAAALTRTLAVTALVPTVAYHRDNLDRLRDMLLRGTSYTLAVTLPFTLAGFVFTGPIIRAWIGAGHGNSVAPARWLLLSLAPGFAMAVGRSMMMALGRYRPMLIMVSAWTVANVSLSFLLVRPLGVNGVVIATIIPTVIMLFPMVRLFLSEVQASYGRWLREAFLPHLPGSVLQLALGFGLLLPLAERSHSLLVVLSLCVLQALVGFATYFLVGLDAGGRSRLRTTIRRALTAEDSRDLERPSPLVSDPDAPQEPVQH